jgi:hypothetical protein
MPPELGCCLGGGHMAEVVDGVDALRRAARERLRTPTRRRRSVWPWPAGSVPSSTGIGPGAVADLLVLDGDPLRDPSVLWAERPQ